MALFLSTNQWIVWPIRVFALFLSVFQPRCFFKLIWIKFGVSLLCFSVDFEFYCWTIVWLIWWDFYCWVSSWLNFYFGWFGLVQSVLVRFGSSRYWYDWFSFAMVPLYDFCYSSLYKLLRWFLSFASTLSFIRYSAWFLLYICVILWSLPFCIFKVNL